MSRLLLERLRAALAGGYEVLEELGTGGMGAVYLARDATLDRLVAIKVLLPGQATAAAAERFLREARILAKLSHPNVVPVHTAGEADGLFYYVMDYVSGETLAERLARGPIAPEEGEEQVVKLGADVLAALEAAHAHGVVHRDVKPSNIFLVDERALLGDFGIAKAADSASPALTSPGTAVGTPGYMPPEQLGGGEATPRTDLYALGMVLYEAATGRRWSPGVPLDEADWSGVSSELERVLRRALAWTPEERFPDAASFRRALVRPAKRRLSVAGALRTLALSGAIAGLFLLGREVLERRATAVEINELAVLPVQVMGSDAADLDGEDLAVLVARKLERMGVTVVSLRRSFAWWDSVSVAGTRASPERAAAAALGARRAAFATLQAAGSRPWAELDVFDADGDPLPGARVIEFARGDFREVADSLTLRLAQLVLGEGAQSPVPQLTRDPDALIEFILGEKAFERGLWSRAVSYYDAAVARDSSFILAWWHMANAWRFLGHPGPHPADYRRLFDRYGSALSPADSLLLAAQLTPAGPERFARYREAHRRYPANGFAAFLFGEELFNRGPLWGEPLDSAAALLEAAVALNPTWVPAVFHLFWAQVRLGRPEEARRELDRLARASAGRQEGWYPDPALLSFAYVARFEPEGGTERLREGLAHPRFESPDDLPVLARLAGAFDVPDVEVALGRRLAAKTAWPASHRAAGHLAVGMGLMALGRIREGASSFDSAAALLATPEARLAAAEWHVLPGALAAAVDLPPGGAPQEASARAALESLMQQDSLRARAAWALAVDAYARGAVSAARALAERVKSASEAGNDGGLGTLLAAMDSAARGRWEAALHVSDGLPALQAETVPLRGAEALGPLGDPFARTTLHLLRGYWRERLGADEGARREWLWHQAVDVDGLPALELPQAGEVDWAFGSYGRYLRGISALGSGDLATACRELRRSAELWKEADAGLVELAERARAGARRACS